MVANDDIYLKVFEHSGDGIVVLIHKKIELANIQAASIMGYPVRQLTGRPISDFIFKNDRLKAEKLLNHTMSGSDLEESTLRLIDKVGGITWCECRSMAIKWRDGQAVLVLMRDITGNVKNLKDLEEKDSTLKGVLKEIEGEKKQMALQIQSNIDKVIIPILSNLKQNIDATNRHYYDLLISSLKSVTSPFISRLEIQFSQLTPRELQICLMIRNGLSSKQIASALNNSLETVRKQRKIIRKKLGINSRDQNLASFLKKLV